MAITDLIPGVGQGKLILAGVALAAFAVPVAGWTITAHTLKGARQTIALDKANMAAESNAHQVTIASLGECNAQLAIKSGESDKRHDDYAAAQAAQQAADAKNDALQQTVEAQHAALLAMSKVPGGSCQVPPALIGNLGGL